MQPLVEEATIVCIRLPALLLRSRATTLIISGSQLIRPRPASCRDELSTCDSPVCEVPRSVEKILQEGKFLANLWKIVNTYLGTEARDSVRMDTNVDRFRDYLTFIEQISLTDFGGCLLCLLRCPLFNKINVAILGRSSGPVLCTLVDLSLYSHCPK